MNDPENAADLAAWETEYTDGALASWEAEQIDKAVAAKEAAEAGLTGSGLSAGRQPWNDSLEANERALNAGRPRGCRDSWATCLYKKSCPVELSCWIEQVYRPWLAKSCRFSDRPAIESEPAQDAES